MENQTNWKLIAHKLPPLEELVWLKDMKGWVCLGCRTNTPDGWLWAVAASLPYIEDGKLVADCEFDDLEPVAWHPVPKI